MTVNVQIVRGANENTQSVLRKFTRKTQGTGIVKTVRDGRYYETPMSSQVKRKKALKRIKKGSEIARLYKEGKLVEKKNNRKNAPTQTQSNQPAEATATV